MLKHHLKEIANFAFGPHLQTSSKGDVPYLQASQLGEEGEYLGEAEAFVSAEAVPKALLLKPGELVLAGKGLRHPAWAYPENLGPMIPSSIFYVIRPTHPMVNPVFLATFLNLPATQAQIKALAAGSNVPSLRKSELGNLVVPLPDLAIQEKIAAIKRLHTAEMRLIDTLKTNLAQRFQGVVQHLIND
jgi:hypothetical protein